jgi:hypothetical protein
MNNGTNYAGALTLAEANAKIEATKGRYFGVSFLKASGGIRHMTARLGVRKGTSGAGLKFNPAKRGLRVVSETVTADPMEAGLKATTGTQFRMIPRGPRLLSLRVGGKAYSVLPPIVD